MAIADAELGVKIMTALKSTIVLATVIAAVAVGACRREVPHSPMKLGADVPVAGQVAR
jgi:hypothetical protein